jgi:PAS domain S-box-containing protein
MQLLHDRPIREKLVIITLLTTGTALVLAWVGNMLADSLLYRGYLMRDLTVLARVIADNSTAALVFEDPAAANQILGALKARPHIDGACMYRNAGQAGATVFAKYSPNRDFTCPPLDRIGSIHPDRALSEPVVLDGRRIGTLVLIFDLEELRERIRMFGSIVFAVFLLCSVIAFLVSNRLHAVIVTPIARLVEATTTVSRTGDYSVRAERVSGDELGVLVDRFNEMLARIQSRDNDVKKAFQQVENERARFQFMAESMPQKIFTATPEGEIDYFNGQWMEFTGLTREEIMGWGWIRFVHPDDVEANVQEWQRCVASGDPFMFQQRFRRADGQYRWHLSRAHGMRDPNGTITIWIGSNTDIHEQKETEQELRRLNDDLQQFAYSASHDLQEPIRNVAVYSEIVARRYQQVLDADGQQFLGFLREGGRRLATLVNDLLAYTRASMAELSGNSISAREALDNSLATLAEPIHVNGAVVTSDELPAVHMGELHLQQIFQNLIGNALKYRSEEPPRIHISARMLGRMWWFSVRDNGIGIDPEYKEKIFGVFKRLSHDRKHDGTGIGLAICQRIVERYGGRIWVESELGKGAIFHFTIPDGPATSP